MNARKLSDASLAWTINDLREVIEAQEAMILVGHRCPKLGQYWDDLFACTTERKRRARKAVA